MVFDRSSRLACDVYFACREEYRLQYLSRL
jgi:hypothetical protein